MIKNNGLDLDNLESHLREVVDSLDARNYGIAETHAWIAWGDLTRFLLAIENGDLPATYDRDLRALLTKAKYWVLNRMPMRCRLLGYNCEWVYPYGWVPEGGCPDHD